MSMYFIKTPEILKRIYPNQVWSYPVSDKKLYLTFDDGPTPNITEWVLRELKKYSARATFFLVGQNAERYPEIVSRIKKEGHAIGNHTYRHVNGWMTSPKPYLKDVLKCDEILHTKLFFFFYSRITRSQTRMMMNRYRVIMWDVLSGDFDHSITAERCLKNVIENTLSGSIVVFHDSMKAADRLQYVLPRTLDHFSAKGYSFDRISSQ